MLEQIIGGIINVYYTHRAIKAQERLGQQRADELREFGEQLSRVNSGTVKQAEPEPLTDEDIRRAADQIQPWPPSSGKYAHPESTGSKEAPPPPAHAGTSQMSAAGKACIPCGGDHFSTVAGLLAEAMRFARTGGVEHEEVILRIGQSEDELNAFERVDGAPYKVADLPPDEKALMDEMMNASRQLRHQLSDITSVDDLEAVASDAMKTRIEFRSKIFQMALGRLTPEDKERVKKRAQAIIEGALEGGEGGGGV